MQFAVSTPNFGVGLDADAVGDLAVAAEAAGWDALFLWDHTFAFPPGPVDLVDPWIALTVAAMRTSRIRLGTAVTPLPRRRPVPGRSEASTPASVVAAHADAGATWWVEPVEPWRYGLTGSGPWPWAAMRGRIGAGPPGAG